MSYRAKRMRELGLIPEGVKSSSQFSSNSRDEVKRKRVILKSLNQPKGYDNNKALYFIVILFLIVIGFYVTFRVWEIFLGLFLLPFVFLLKSNKDFSTRSKFQFINYDSYLESHNRFKEKVKDINDFQELLCKLEDDIFYLFSVKDRLFVEDFHLLKSLLEKDLPKLFYCYVDNEENRASCIKILSEVDGKIYELRERLEDKDIDYRVAIKKISEKVK